MGKSVVDETGAHLLALADGVPSSDRIPTIRCALERITFLLFWSLQVNERHLTAKSTQLKASSHSTHSKSSHKRTTTTTTTTNHTHMDSGDEVSWPEQKQQALKLLATCLHMDLASIWTLMNERAPFVSMLMDLANIMLESDQNLKHPAIKATLFEIMSLCVQKYDQLSSNQPSHPSPSLTHSLTLHSCHRCSDHDYAKLKVFNLPR